MKRFNDVSLEDPGSLTDPGVLAFHIIANLATALEQFNGIEENLRTKHQA